VRVWEAIQVGVQGAEGEEDENAKKVSQMGPKCALALEEDEETDTDGFIAACGREVICNDGLMLMVKV
jgi:hypothetical protein